MVAFCSIDNMARKVRREVDVPHQLLAGLQGKRVAPFFTETGKEAFLLCGEGWLRGLVHMSYKARTGGGV